MEVDAYQVEVCTLPERLDGIAKLPMRNTELVFIQSRRDVLVRLCIHVWINPQGYIGFLAQRARQPVNHEQFLDGFDVKRENITFERVNNFLIGFPNAS